MIHIPVGGPSGAITKSAFACQTLASLEQDYANHDIVRIFETLSQIHHLKNLNQKLFVPANTVWSTPLAMPPQPSLPVGLAAPSTSNVLNGIRALSAGNTMAHAPGLSCPTFLAAQPSPPAMQFKSSLQSAFSSPATARCSLASPLSSVAATSPFGKRTRSDDDVAPSPVKERKVEDSFERSQSAGPGSCSNSSSSTPTRNARGARVCQHGRQRSKCRQCGGVSICPHDRVRNMCKVCGGASICEHGRQRSVCRDCGGSQICEHQRRRSRCKECKGAQICEHGRRRTMCKECGGASICPHQRERRLCRDCGGSGICEHDKQRRHCRMCIASASVSTLNRGPGPSSRRMPVIPEPDSESSRPEDAAVGVVM